MARHIEQQVLSHHAHQIDTCIAHVIFGVILAKARAHVTVNGVEPLSDCTGTINIGFFSNNYFLVLPPVARFKRGTGTTEACATDQNIDIVLYYCLVVAHQ